MLLAPALYLGRAEAWLADFDEFVELAGAASQAVEFGVARAVCLAELGREEGAHRLLGPQLEQIEGGPNGDEANMYLLAWHLQAAVLLSDQRTAVAVSERLKCVSHLSIGEGFYTCPARHLGEAAALLGDLAGARAYYSQALEAAGKIRFRPEVALTHLRLAESLFQEPDDAARSEALEHLDIAIRELIDMKMQPALIRAQALRETVAPAAQAPARESAPDVLTARERQYRRFDCRGSEQS
jgi:tetratricopeptide (TPR) repeat protein